MKCNFPYHHLHDGKRTTCPGCNNAKPQVLVQQKNKVKTVVNAALDVLRAFGGLLKASF